MSNQPLHKAFLSCNWSMLRYIATQNLLNTQSLRKIIHMLSYYSSENSHISPLQAAILVGDYKVCKHLITEGADFSSPSISLLHPLNMALDTNQYQIAELILNSGVDVNQSQQQFFPMYFAIKTNTPVSIIQKIIAAGFPPNSVIETIFFVTSLHRAVSCGNVPVVKFLLECKVDCNKRDLHKGNTPLHLAIKCKQLEIIKLLIEYKADLEVECLEGFSALLHAVNTGDTASVQILLQNGARVHQSSTGRVPLHLAVSLNNAKIVEMLLKHSDIDVNLPDPSSWDTPLHCAALSHKGKISIESSEMLKTIIRLLVEYGSDINARNKNGYTPIQLAIKEENFQSVELLLKEGAEINRQLGTSFHLTLYHDTDFHLISKRGSKKLVELFLEYGADFRTLNCFGITPYQMAMINPEKDLLKCFWKFGCPFDLKCKTKGPVCGPDVCKAIQNQLLFMSGIHSNDVMAVDKALSSGAEVRGCSEFMPHPLHYAVENGFMYIVFILLTGGVPPNTFNGEGKTPLHIAASKGYDGVCSCLLQFGAAYNVKTKTTKETPLELAQTNGHAEVVRLLKLFGSLFKACCVPKRAKYVLKTIVKHDNDFYFKLCLVNAMNRNGDTLMALMLKNGHSKIAEEILKFRLQLN